jgi:hypothetical protein
MLPSELGEAGVNTSKLRVTALLVGAVLSSVAGACWGQEEEQPASFAMLSYATACDSQNKRLVLENTHTYKTLHVTVRWRAAGGKDLQDQFFPAPSSKVEIGCAADAQIVDVKFAEF